MQDERTCAEMDASMERCFASHDALILKQQALAAALKEGFWQLAKARYAMGSSLSPLYFDLGTRASAVVNVNCTCGTEAPCGPCMSLAKASEPVAEPGQVPKKRREPLYWYGCLPPPALREAQGHFTRALAAAVEAADAHHRAVAASKRYEELRGSGAAK
eukprot:m51a1_g7498 hypothetical protein (160) ;mRNA; r:261069-261712